MNLALLSAVEQHRLLVDKQVAATELLDACIAQYEVHNPQVNAVIETRIDAAKAQARHADDEAASGRLLGPLHGLPMTIKDSIDWTGVPSTWGDPEHADHRPVEDADVLKQLLAAGVVVYGKTNVPLHLGDWQTHNEIHGRTNSPWDLARSAGGSSGGSAVAVATGMASLEIGSDIGGSIRWPSNYNGVAGLKPSFDLVSPHGHTYPGHEGTVDNNVVGPIARTVADLSMVLPTMWQPHMCPPATTKTSLSEFTVGVLFDNPVGDQDAAVSAVLQGALATLVDAGVNVVAPPPIDWVLAGHDAGMQLVRAASSGLVKSVPPASEAERFDRGERDYDAFVAKAQRMTYREWIDAHNERERARLRWRDYFADVDLLLTPITPTTAPPHDDRRFSDQTVVVNGVERPVLEQWFWAGLANAMYLPGLALPVGLAPDGLPVGLQVLGPFMGDRLALRFGELAETVLDHPLDELHRRL